MWIGLLHHVRGEHVWSLDAFHHGPLVESREQWIQKGSLAPQRLTELILDARWLRNIYKYQSFRYSKMYNSKSRKVEKDYSYISDLQNALLPQRVVCY
eukprot:superscaffoldBa00002016_g12887